MAKDRDEKTVPVTLNHICHMPGCEGMPGQKIVVTEKNAELLLERGGIQKPKPETADKPQPKPKTGGREQPESR